MVLQIAVAFFGHNLVHTFERFAFPLLVVIFVIASVVILQQVAPTARTADRRPRRLPDHVRRGVRLRGRLEPLRQRLHPLPAKPDTNRRATGLWAGLGVFLSCVVLEIVGAAAATITSIGKYADNPTAGFTSHLPTWLADVTLLAIALGAVCANALNVYSGSMSFLALGVRLPLTLRRAIVALVFGVAGFFLALAGLHDAGEKYNNFLLVIAYWIGPWLGVFFADQFLRRGKRVDGFLFDRKHNPWARLRGHGHRDGGVDLLLRQPDRLHRRGAPSTSRQFGDIAFEVGFVLAAALYALFFRLRRAARRSRVSEDAARSPDRRRRRPIRSGLDRVGGGASKRGSLAA